MFMIGRAPFLAFKGRDGVRLFASIFFLSTSLPALNVRIRTTEKMISATILHAGIPLDRR